MKRSVLAISLCLSVLATATAMAAEPGTIDWSAISATSVPLFYPGQSSYEWLRSSAHKGSTQAKTGESCVSCHDEKDLGNELVKVGRLEPTPVKGKNGLVDLSVQAAYDTKNDAAGTIRNMRQTSG